MILQPGSQVDHYQIVHFIAMGGMGEVYLARDNISRDVAVKVIRIDILDDPAKREEAFRHFKREAKAMGSLNHAHILPLHVLREATVNGVNIAYMVMPFCHDGSLDAWLRQRVPLAPQEVATLLLQAADALQCAHSEHIIHRDVKPANFLLRQKKNSPLPDILLADFGIAAMMEGTTTQEEGVLRGTAAYMAPEQWCGRPPNYAIDQYALAVIAYQMLTGRTPFQGDLAKLLHDHCYKPPDPPSKVNPSLSPEIDGVVLKALAKEPNARFPTVFEFATAFQDALEPKPGGQPTGGEHRALSLWWRQFIQWCKQSISEAFSSSFLALLWWSKVLLGARKRNKKRLPLFCGLLLTVLVASFFSYYGLFVYLPYVNKLCSPAEFSDALSPPPLRALKASDGQCIGLSDGRFAFDMKRPDAQIKRDAAEAFRKGDTSQAESAWRQALQIDTNDAEAGIYLQDQQMHDSGQPYITFIVVATLTGDDLAVNVGRDLLQGAYVAQKEYNDSTRLPNQVRVVLLVANVSWASPACPDTCANSVVDQLVEAANGDQHIKGIIGWPAVGETTALKRLADAGLPVISTTSSDWTGVPPSFFHVAPTLQDQAGAAVNYATSHWQVKTAALFSDLDNSYSSTLANDFKQAFVKAGGRIVYAGLYTVGHTNGLEDYLHAALQVNPDLIYFAGYSRDVSDLIKKLKHLTRSPPRVMGGDALYRPGGIPPPTLYGFDDLYFTASAFPDEWDGAVQAVKNCKSGSFQPAFFCEYIHDFDPAGKYPNAVYGYTRQDGDVMLAYDAALTFFSASSQLLSGTITNFTLQAFQVTLSGTQDLQGITGLINFTPSTPKAVVVMRIREEGFNQFADPDPLQSIVGPFLCPSSASPAIDVGISCSSS